jgi:hypothetical protein
MWKLNEKQKLREDLLNKGPDCWILYIRSTPYTEEEEEEEEESKWMR